MKVYVPTNMVANPLITIENKEITSFKIAKHQKEWLEKLVATHKFSSRSEGIRYCIQFNIDFASFADVFAKEILKHIIKGVE